MDLSKLGLTTEQISSIETHIQEVTGTLKIEYENKLKVLNDELAKYKPEDKTDAEKALDERIKALEDREKEIAAKERLQTIKESLKAKGISEELASILNIGDNVDADIEKVSKILSGMKVNDSYNPSNHAGNKGITKEKFQTMNYMERSKLYSENPELYKSLSGQM